MGELEVPPDPVSLLPELDPNAPLLLVLGPKPVALPVPVPFRFCVEPPSTPAAACS